jgi:hypothetical protein
MTAAFAAVKVEAAMANAAEQARTRRLISSPSLRSGKHSQHNSGGDHGRPQHVDPFRRRDTYPSCAPVMSRISRPGHDITRAHHRSARAGRQASNYGPIGQEQAFRSLSQKPPGSDRFASENGDGRVHAALRRQWLSKPPSRPLTSTLLRL